MRVRAGREVDAAEARRLLGPSLDWATAVSAAGTRVVTRDDEVAGAMIVWRHPDHLLVEAVAGDADATAALLDVAEREALEAGVNRVVLPSGAERRLAP